MQVWSERRMPTFRTTKQGRSGTRRQAAGFGLLDAGKKVIDSAKRTRWQSLGRIFTPNSRVGVSEKIPMSSSMARTTILSLPPEMLCIIYQHLFNLSHMPPYSLKDLESLIQSHRLFREVATTNIFWGHAFNWTFDEKLGMFVRQVKRQDPNALKVDQTTS